MLKGRIAKAAVAAVLAVGLVPGVAFAAEQVEGQLAPAQTLQVQALPESFEYDGDTVTFADKDLKAFGMFMSSGDPVVIDYALEKGKVHVQFTPKNRSVYEGFYLNASNEDKTTWDESNYIRATGTAAEKNFAFDFKVDPKYCGTATPIAPKKASDGESTSTQYYLAIPAIDAELAVTNTVPMFRPAEKATLKLSGEASTLVLTMQSESYSNAFLGTAEEAAKAAEKDLAAFDKESMAFNIAVGNVEIGEPFVASFQSANNGNWYERELTIDVEANTLAVNEYVPVIASSYMYRLYNPWTGEHFYTAVESERDEVVAAGWNYENIGWAAPSKDESVPVYRMYNSFAGEHHYTLDAAEKDKLIAAGWTDEGTGWYSDSAQTVKVYREYNPNEYSWNHNYTTDEAEHNYLVSIGWSDEGVGWYAVMGNDEANAKNVDELIAKIQVQVRTETTDADCAAAKAAWDGLTEAQKALVEEADYFAADTGDASADNPLNADGFGENEILVVSFGTSFNDSRVADIGGVEKAIAQANPDWAVRRAFTAQIIINHIQARDGEAIDNMDQALARAEANGVKNLVVQPTHLMHGAEYDELVAALEPYQSKMSIKVAEPLLGEVGSKSDDINADKEAVAKAVVAATADEAGYKDAAAAKADGTAFVFMGHGTEHAANVTYEQMQAQMASLGYDNVFIGTVEGKPESTECGVVIDKVKDAGYKKVILCPLMVVAGDHANNDMADEDDEESWISQFKAADAFDSVTCQISGLGRIADIQKIYVDHTAAVL